MALGTKEKLDVKFEISTVVAETAIRTLEVKPWWRFACQVLISFLV